MIVTYYKPASSGNSEVIRIHNYLMEEVVLDLRVYLFRHTTSKTSFSYFAKTVYKALFEPGYAISVQRQPPKPNTGVPSVRKHILMQRALFFEMVTQVACNIERSKAPKTKRHNNQL